MAGLGEEQIVAALGRMVVADVAPGEILEFDAISAAYFRNPQFVVPIKVRKDASAGMALALGYLTPMILSVANQIVSQFFADRLQDSVAQSGRGVWARVRGSLGAAWQEPGEERDDAPEPVALRPEQLAEVRHVALEKARQLNLPDVQAQLLADAMVGSLSLLAVDDGRAARVQ